MAKTAKKAARKRAPGKVSQTQPAAGMNVNVAGFKRILNCEPSRETQRDWTIEHALRANLTAPAIPPSCDLRAAWWAIGDQGSTGSCVGWATADSVLRWHFTKANRIKKTDRLSVRFAWMAAKEFDEYTSEPTTFIESDGTSLKGALDIARKYGQVLDPVLPFASGALYQGEVETFYATASMLKIANYINLGRNLSSWRAWIANNGPILTRLTCDNVWMNAKATKGVLAQYDQASADGGHAVALVGYDANMFIVRNSWGTTQWGDKGFAYASNQYAAAAFTEAYGVTVIQ